MIPVGQATLLADRQVRPSMFFCSAPVETWGRVFYFHRAPFLNFLSRCSDFVPGFHHYILCRSVSFGKSLRISLRTRRQRAIALFASRSVTSG